MQDDEDVKRPREENGHGDGHFQVNPAEAATYHCSCRMEPGKYWHVAGLQSISSTLNASVHVLHRRFGAVLFATACFLHVSTYMTLAYHTAASPVLAAQTAVRLPTHASILLCFTVCQPSPCKDAQYRIAS